MVNSSRNVLEYINNHKSIFDIGLDPAAPGFENIPIHLPHLNSTNANFVDVIHTTAESVGFIHNIGHVDFYPNSGRAPQPGCDSLLNLFDFSKYIRSIKRIMIMTT